MVSENLQKLRQLMSDHRLSAYIVPSTDPHQSEYLPDCWKRRQLISGFTGSAGEAVILSDRAFLWTDSRYFIQADRELDPTYFSVQKSGQPETLPYPQWLRENLPRGATVGVDPALFSCETYENLSRTLAEKEITLKPLEINLIDAIWPNQPARPAQLIRSHPLGLAGKSHGEKLKKLRGEMSARECDWHLITTLDTLAWFFNLRGGDIPFNPLFLGFAAAGQTAVHLFTTVNRVPADWIQSEGAGVILHPYSDFSEFVGKLQGRIWLDPQTTSKQWHLLLKTQPVLFAPSPLTLEKAMKNDAELKGMEEAHRRDGVAMVKFLRWLQLEVPQGSVTEIGAGEKLLEFRREGKNFVGPSFETIAGFKENGAVVHYRATPVTNKTLTPDGIFLIDSGGQYLDGTTDITRTVSLGSPTAEQKDCFTRVLRGHIALDTIRFPEGTTGGQLDTLARVPLWEKGLNYGHGTGHGVGAYLNVHEGPQSLNASKCRGIALKPGMVCSNEPGFYKPGEFGMRFENLFKVVRESDNGGSPNGFLRCQTLTLCPIDLELVDIAQLTEKEISWINSTHSRVLKTLMPLLDETHQLWLSGYARFLSRSRKEEREDYFF